MPTSSVNTGALRPCQRSHTTVWPVMAASSGLGISMTFVGSLLLVLFLRYRVFFPVPDSVSVSHTTAGAFTGSVCLVCDDVQPSCYL